MLSSSASGAAWRFSSLLVRFDAAQRMSRTFFLARLSFWHNCIELPLICRPAHPSAHLCTCLQIPGPTFVPTNSASL